LKKHTKIYLKWFGYGPEDWIPCEICERKCVDIHHIDARGMGGSKEKDTIENLMGLCRECHELYGDVKEAKEDLKKIHSLRMEIRKR
jgi:5-methylcytosine-specific restriction endonuclease McrA